MNTLKLISILLDYPHDELWQHREELHQACQHLGAKPRQRDALAAFAVQLLDAEPLEAQSRWIETFDRGRSMSLLLFEHIHGESRDRGQAMVDLIENYRRLGFELATRELPDYLPLLLEVLAQQTEAVANEWLQHLGPILALLAARATQRQSPYAELFRVLRELAGAEHELAAHGAIDEQVRDDTPAAMDAVWEEEAVRFGPGTIAAPCAGMRQKPRDQADPVHIVG